MKVWYSVEVQMLGEHERDNDFDADVGNALGFVEGDIMERESYKLIALFTSKKLPSEMLENVKAVLNSRKDVYYIDVIYRWDSENVPDRFVLWSDGRIKEYTGKIIFEEDY